MPDPHPTTPYESLLAADPTADAAPPVEGHDIAPFVAQLKETADKLVRDGATRGDAKLLATAARELRYCFQLFAKYKHRRKVTIFGSARTLPDHPAFKAAEALGRRMADLGYMVITGAGGGIMEAGHRGAGRENSFGLNILLPFEQAANPVVLGDPKLMNLRYFFTRKLMFLKESDAIALLPGGFGTHDEAFETLTLIQTGKSHIFPIVLLDEPGGDYWRGWERFVDESLLARGYISLHDKHLYRITDSVEEAAAEVANFYRRYHSMRYVKGRLVLRMQSRLPDAALAHVRTEFADVLAGGGEFEQTDPLPAEANEPTLASLPRLAFRFDRAKMGRLRKLIDYINEVP